MVLQHRISLLLLLCSSPLVFSAGNSSAAPCDRRCLANTRVARKLLSAPQNDNCTVVVNITSIQYETLSFDTKGMEMTSRIKVNMEWRDPDLGWMQERSRFPTIILPVDRIWIPGIVLDNACEINLFNYPFVNGECPVAINGWSQKSCALKLQISEKVSLVPGSGGEWQTTGVFKTVDSSDRVYLKVLLSINPFGAVVTLILPSALIMLADLVSSTLPFEGGERNTFKVTLVLSFTMFLLILNDHLPNGGSCSPLLYYHFSFCLACLVLSTLTSIVLSRLSVEDSFLLCKRRSAKVQPSNNRKRQHDSLDQEKDTGVMTTKCGDSASLQKILNFLDNLDEGEKETKNKVAFAYRLDRFCFVFFLSIYILYTIIIISITQTDICKVNNLDFWDNSKNEDNYYDYSEEYP